MPPQVCVIAVVMNPLHNPKERHQASWSSHAVDVSYERSPYIVLTMGKPPMGKLQTCEGLWILIQLTSTPLGTSHCPLEGD